MKTGFESLKSIVLSALFLATLFSFFASASCFDSDGGRNYNIFGHVYGMSGTQQYDYADACVNATYLKEYFCFMTGPYGHSVSEVHACAQECRLGFCYSAPQFPTPSIVYPPSPTPTVLPSPTPTFNPTQMPTTPPSQNPNLRVAASVDKTSVAPGETLTATLSFTCISSPCNRGGVAFNYPTEAFELVSSSVTPALYTSASSEYDALHVQYPNQYPYNPERTFNGLGVCNEGSANCWKILEWYDVPSGWNTVVTLRAKTPVQLPGQFPQITQYPVPLRYRAWAVPSPYSTYYGDPLANPLTNCDTWGFWVQSDVLRCNYYSRTMPIIIPIPSPSPSPSAQPTQTVAPSAIPSFGPSITPSFGPTITPSSGPSITPSFGPSITPSFGPTITPSSGPSTTPSTLPSIIPSSLPSVTPPSGVYSCALIPGEATIEGGTVQEFRAKCERAVDDAVAIVDCPPLSWSTTITGGSMNPTATQSSASRSVFTAPRANASGTVTAFYASVTAPTTAQDKGGETHSLSFASAINSFSCSASVSVKTGAPVPTPMPPRSCIVHPQSATVPQGGMFNFVASCFSTATPPTAAADLASARVACPSLCWTTSVAGGTMTNSENSGTIRVSETAVAPQSGRVTASSELLQCPQAVLAPNAAALAFQGGFSCNAPVSIESACINGWRVETREIAIGKEVSVGEYVFKLEDLSSNKAIVYGKRAKPAIASTSWDLCGSIEACIVALGGTLSMPPSTAKEDEEALVTFTRFVSANRNPATQATTAANAGANEASFATQTTVTPPAASSGERAVLTIKVRCASTAPSCSITPNPASGRGAFSQKFTVTFKNVFGDAVAAGAKAIVSCKEDEVAPAQVSVGSNGIVTFNCDYPAVDKLTYYTASASFGKAACKASVQNQPSLVQAEGVTIASPTEGGEYWAKTVSLRFTVTGKDYYKCEYALYDAAGGKAYAIDGAVQAGAEKKLEIPVSFSGQWLKVRCKSATTAAASSDAATQGGWLASKMVSFKVFEPDRPIIFAPDQNYRHYGLTTPVKAEFRIGGSLNAYSCYYVLDGKAYQIGKVSAGKNEFTIYGKEWKHAEKHLLSVRCASPSAGGATPTSAPTATAPPSQAEWSCSLSPSSANVLQGGKQTFAVNCFFKQSTSDAAPSKVECPKSIASALQWRTTVEGGEMAPKSGAASSVLTIASTVSQAQAKGMVYAHYPTSTLTAGVNEFECSASVNGVASATPTPNQHQTAVAANAEALDFASYTSWPAVQPGEKESPIIAFYTYEDGRPAILAPEEGKAYGSPVELAFVVGGGSAAYYCVPAFDSIEEKSVEVKPGEIVKQVKEFNSGNHKTNVKCAPLRGNAVGTSALVSSGDVSFTVINTNQPVIVSPKNGEVVKDSIDFAFFIDGDYLAYDCRGTLTRLAATADTAARTVPMPSLTVAPTVETCKDKCNALGFASWKCGGGAVVPPFDYCKSVGGGEDIGETSDCSMPTGIVGAVKRCCCQKPLAPTTIDFGRVTRKSCGTPEKASKTVKDLAPGKYKAQVFCNSVNTIACKAIAETAGASELEFAGYSSDAVTFEVNPLATPTPTPSVTISPSSTPSVVPSVTPSASPIPSCGNGVCEASLGETVSNCPTDCSAGGGGVGGGGRPCTSNSDCGMGSVCVNGVCNGCLCLLDGYCNPCCIAGTDKDCGQTQNAQQTLGGTGTKTLPDDDSEWPPATQPTYAPQYALKLKCVLTEQKKVAATLTADGSPACDANMRITIGKRTLAPDASKCVQSGVHEFDVSGLEAGEYSAKATSLGGSTATCKFVMAAAGFAFEPWMWIVLALVVIAIAGGAYYWKQQQDKKKSGGSGGKGKRDAAKAEEETTDLLEEE